VAEFLIQTIGTLQSGTYLLRGNLMDNKKTRITRAKEILLNASLYLTKQRISIPLRNQIEWESINLAIEILDLLYKGVENEV
jgi:hypothetical protein